MVVVALLSVYLVESVDLVSVELVVNCILSVNNELGFLVSIVLVEGFKVCLLFLAWADG